MLEEPNDIVLGEIEAGLERSTDQLGDIYRLLKLGLSTNRELVEGGGAANPGAAANVRVIVEVLTKAIIPRAPSVALMSARRIRSFKKRKSTFSSETNKYLDSLLDALQEVIFSDAAASAEDKELEKDSRDLELAIGNKPGIYVYSLPTFLRVPQKFDPERYWLKIGKTTRTADGRISEQQRQTGLPEDPILVRVYSSATIPLDDAEKIFHRLLSAAGHGQSSGKYSGKEWFATNVEFLDEIANSHNFEITSISKEAI